MPVWMILMRSVSDVRATELTARQINAGHAGAVLAVATGAARLEQPSAVLDVGRRVAVVLGRQRARRGHRRKDEIRRLELAALIPPSACR